ncbi:thiol reductant ABC exporter subunit CydC [Enterococcus malodoratus]|uniref:Thiol reductant ABC exporter, CydC subunit n=1 Tax=Enterococcus malodoratus ATCC 43197 TaxID=1158601 RepID=R2NSP5_9ENTE|nr:thiol reductant ABC exporter subunit CydC [Enterococcus malodoratus]EOH75072.1 thiol reductant ABC exporter, CydC subunit [Enterococcus malodoratus ATCC 43197]EOT66974.1 thiol reductant ABC exporter, CydC subunit [Enterococcus malodoratus ATCC 43197]SPX03904.1 thiol reductant ABC exporter, CydC subunit [Enterococcus malodoratus]STD69774.1 thiol reductant ABC exporter, CydC subunit [Enterococcus malodoratus]
MNRIGLFQVLKTDEWVKPFFKQYKRSLILALVLGFITFFCAGALMFNSGFLISRAASLPENILLIYVPIVLTRAFGIGRPVFRYVERLVSHNWVLKMTSNLRVKLYDSLEQDAIFFKQNHRTGDILGLLSEDINHIQNLYLRTIFPTIIAWLLYAFIIIGIGYFSPFFALAMLLLLGIVVFLLPLWSVIINGARQEQQKQMKNQLYSDLTDNVLGVSDWIFSQRGQDYVNHHEESEEALREVNRKLQSFQRKRNFVLQLMFGVITLALLLWTSRQFPGNHGGAANWIAAFVLSVFPLIDAFAPLPAAAQETNSYQDSIKNLNDLPAIQKNQSAVPSISGPVTLKIDQVHYHYPESAKKVLSGIDLTLHPGEKIAILGRSGSGKSTLANLIRGDLRATEGAITLNGEETYKFGDDISSYLGVIHQTLYLFHTTIANNLRIGRESATEAELWQVLNRVELRELVESLPDGLETMVDEAGLRFSGGERQRLALARILLQEAPIILLDEPTVGLDPVTEQALINTFFHELEDKTVIWITHHLQGIDAMDQVIFIEDGHLAMQGRPNELKQTNAHYRKLKQIDKGII